KPADTEIRLVEAAARQLRSDRQWRINLGALGIVKLGRHYPNDGARSAVGGDCFVDDVWISPEATLPQIVCEKRYCIFAGLAFLRRKATTQQGLHSDDVEKISRDLEALHALWRVSAGKVGAPPTINSELLKRLVLRAPVKIVRHGNFVAFDSAAGDPFPHRHDAIDIRKRQRLE